MIRPAKTADINTVLEVYATAREFMRSNGNPTQWGSDYPYETIINDDIAKGQLFVVIDDDTDCIVGCFALIYGDDPTYEYIEGEWKCDTPYAAIHRVAGNGKRRGVFEECVAFAKAHFNHLRIDTHEDNKPMQHVVTKNGFEYTGTIYVEDGSPRRAYEWMAE